MTVDRLFASLVQVTPENCSFTRQHNAGIILLFLGGVESSDAESQEALKDLEIAALRVKNAGDNQATYDEFVSAAERVLFRIHPALPTPLRLLMTEV